MRSRPIETARSTSRSLSSCRFPRPRRTRWPQTTAPGPSVEIDTVPSPVQNVQALPGNGNVIITWEPPANDGGQALIEYRLTVTPAGGGSPITVPLDAPQVLCRE